MKQGGEGSACSVRGVKALGLHQGREGLCQERGARERHVWVFGKGAPRRRSSEHRDPESGEAGQASGAARRPAWPELGGKQGSPGKTRLLVEDARLCRALQARVRSQDFTPGMWGLSLGVQPSDVRVCDSHPQSPAQLPGRC